MHTKVAGRYGPGRTLADVSQAWRLYRTWAAVHPRALRGQRTGEIAGRSATRDLATLDESSRRTRVGAVLLADRESMGEW